MSAFKFTIIPKSGGGFRAQAVLSEKIVEADLTAAIATAAGITPAQTETVIKTLFAKLGEAAANNQWSPSLYGTLGMRPTCGGGQTSTDAFQNPDDINADIALVYTAGSIDTWRSGMAIENRGIKGLVTPVISTVKCEKDGVENHYLAGDMLRLIGTNLRFDPANVLQGVFFIKEDNTEVRATVYGPIDPSEVNVLVPAGLTGNLKVRIVAFINGSSRSFTYTGTLS